MIHTMSAHTSEYYINYISEVVQVYSQVVVTKEIALQLDIDQV